MARVTLADIAAMLTAQGERIAALEGAPAKSARKARKARAEKPRTFATAAERAAGNGFPCTAPEPCSRKDLRTAHGASSHDPEHDGWHTAK